MKKHNGLEESIMETFKHFGPEAFLYIKDGDLRVGAARIEEFVWGASQDFVFLDVCNLMSKSIYNYRMMGYEET